MVGIVVGLVTGQPSSSSPSLQSRVPSHFELLVYQLLDAKQVLLVSHLGMQAPSPQVNWSCEHVGFGQSDSSLGG